MTSPDETAHQAGSAPGGPGTRVGEIVTAVRDLLDTLPHRPERVSVRAGDVDIEVVWPSPGAATPREAPPADPAAEPVPAAVDDGTRWICAPSVGVFYRAPEPGAGPFVEEGETVEAGRQVAIVEAMKLMLPVKAQDSGRVGAILLKDGEPVEYGDRLIELLPDVN